MVRSYNSCRQDVGWSGQRLVADRASVETGNPGRRCGTLPGDSQVQLVENRWVDSGGICGHPEEEIPQCCVLLSVPSEGQGVHEDSLHLPWAVFFSIFKSLFVVVGPEARVDLGH